MEISSFPSSCHLENRFSLRLVGFKRSRMFSIKIFILYLPLVIQGLSWPPPRNRTRRQIIYATACKKFLCGEEWINEVEEEAKLSHLEEVACPSFNWNGSRGHTYLYQKGYVSYTYLEYYFEYGSDLFCIDNCGLTGPFTYSWSFTNFQLARAEARINDVCGSWELKYCNWWAYLTYFRVYFAYFSIPTTILISWANLSTLLNMMGGKPGPALYLHLAEVVSCGIFNVFIAISDCLLFFDAFDEWRQNCAYGDQYVSFVQTSFIMIQYLRFLHQCYLTALLGDRLYGLSRPMEYGQGDLKKRGRNMIILITVGSFLFYLPYFTLYFFIPTLSYWEENDMNTLFDYNKVDTIFSSIAMICTCSLLVVQIVLGYLVERLFKKFLNSSQSQGRDKRQQKKSEKEKRLLLLGTIGLNIVTGVINNTLMVIRNTVFEELFGFDTSTNWQMHLISILDPILNYINGNGSVLIHIFLVKSYKQAFARTFFGRLLFRMKVEPNPGGNMTHSGRHSPSPSAVSFDPAAKSAVTNRGTSPRPPSAVNNYVGPDIDVKKENETENGKL